jgi:hypothetical protein
MRPNRTGAAAIRRLKKVAEEWPFSLWLFSANGQLCVMKVGADGERVYAMDGGVDPAYTVDVVDLPNEGGDW